jgi:hypothetical protein
MDMLANYDAHQVPLAVPLPNSTAIPSTGLYEPLMHVVSSLLLLGTFAVQAILGRPNASPTRRQEMLKRSVDSFVAAESPIALRNLLCNIGSTGCAASGADSGIVIASPDKTNPDCNFFTPLLWACYRLTTSQTFTPGPGIPP